MLFNNFNDQLYIVNRESNILRRYNFYYILSNFRRKPYYRFNNLIIKGFSAIIV